MTNKSFTDFADKFFPDGSLCTKYAIIDIYNHFQEKKPQIQSSEAFEEFWLLYDKKRGKKKSLDIWKRKKLTDNKEEILKAVRLYKKEQPDPVYRKDPERFLTHELWQDYEGVAENQTNLDDFVGNKFNNMF